MMNGAPIKVAGSIAQPLQIPLAIHGPWTTYLRGYSTRRCIKQPRWLRNIIEQSRWFSSNQRQKTYAKAWTEPAIPPREIAGPKAEDKVIKGKTDMRCFVSSCMRLQNGLHSVARVRCFVTRLSPSRITNRACQSALLLKNYLKSNQCDDRFADIGHWQGSSKSS